MTSDEIPRNDTGTPKVDAQPVVARFIEHLTTIPSDKSENHTSAGDRIC